MDARWNLTNKKQVFITQQQYLDLATQFKELSEEAFGTVCSVSVTVMDANKEYTTFMDDDLQQDLNEKNKEHTILQTANIDDVTPETWKNSRYVEMTVKPIEDDKANSPYAFSHVEFRGATPDSATCYAQGDEDSVIRMKEKMLETNKHMLIGDGFASNGCMSCSSSYMSESVKYSVYDKEKSREQKAEMLYQNPDAGETTNPIKKLLRFVFN